MAEERAKPQEQSVTTFSAVNEPGVNTKEYRIAPGMRYPYRAPGEAHGRTLNAGETVHLTQKQYEETPERFELVEPVEQPAPGAPAAAGAVLGEASTGAAPVVPVASQSTAAAPDGVVERRSGK